MKVAMGSGIALVKPVLPNTPPHRALFRTLAVLVVLLLGDGCSRGQASQPAGSGQQLAVTSEQKEPPAAALRTELQPCPPTPVRPSQTGTGSHKVTLSWNASAPAKKPEDNVVGYCVYRRKEDSPKSHRAQHNPTLAERERITPVPVRDTRCVDDAVQDGALYYYVVLGLNAKGLSSSPSKEIAVSVPEAKPRNTSTPDAPLCRAPSAAR
jgi:hypothetical protein